jgi:hypothetical protein
VYPFTYVSSKTTQCVSVSLNVIAGTVLRVRQVPSSVPGISDSTYKRLPSIDRHMEGEHCVDKPVCSHICVH